MFGCFYFKNTLELIPCIIYAKETALSPNEETPQNLCTFGVSEKKKKKLDLSGHYFTSDCIELNWSSFFMWRQNKNLVLSVWID